MAHIIEDHLIERLKRMRTRLYGEKAIGYHERLNMAEQLNLLLNEVENLPINEDKIHEPYIATHRGRAT